MTPYYRFLIIPIALLAAMTITHAQNKIEGIIRDEQTKESLINATIYITDLKMGANADVNGHYEFTNIPNGTFLFEVKYVGYKTTVKRLKIDGNIQQDFLLTQAVSELNEMVVTAVTRTTELKQIPLIIKTADKNQLNQNASTNLIDGLKNIAGVNQITTGAAISKPTIRGLGYNRVITLYDGIRQEGQQWGDEHGIEIDEYAIDRIEIVKGAGSLMYGSDGIAGVLNFISPKAPPIDTVKTQFIANFQSNNKLFGYSLSNAGNKKDVQWLARFSHKLSGNYQNVYDGKVYNSGFKELDGGLFWGITKNWGYSHFNAHVFNTKLGITEGGRDSMGRFIFQTPDGRGSIQDKIATKNDLNSYNIGFPSQTINHFRLTSNTYYVLKYGTINLDLGFQNNKRKEFGDVLNPSNTALFFDLSTFNYNTRYNLQEKHGWETSLGISGMRQQNLNKGLEFLIPQYKLFDVGGFVFTQKNFHKKWLVAGGLRLDNRTITTEKLLLDSLERPTTVNDFATLKFQGIQKNYSSASGSMGLTYQIDKVSSMKFNISQGFRAPNIAEISSNGVHEGSFRYEYGNPDLKSEISHQLDIAYFLSSDHVSFELTPFANFIANYIFSEKLESRLGGDSIPDPLNPIPAFKFAQGNARLLGGEIYLDIHPHPFDWLHIENSFSFVQATQKNQPDSTKFLPFIPPPKYRGELKAQFKTLGKHLNNGYIKFAIDHYFQQNKYFSAYGTETATPAYTLLSAGIGANIQAFKRPDFISLYISAENLVDVVYQNHLSRLKYAPENLATGRIGVFNMGRNVSLKIIVNL
jgi:iron complex outermembrane recepter protein